MGRLLHGNYRSWALNIHHSFRGRSIEATAAPTKVVLMMGILLHTLGTKNIPHMGMVKKDNVNSIMVIHPNSALANFGRYIQSFGSHLYKMASFAKVDFGTKQ